MSETQSPRETTMPPPTVVTLDEAELAVRMIEAAYNLTRPFADAKLSLGAADPDCAAHWERAAAAALLYFIEQTKPVRVSGLDRPRFDA